MPPAVRFTHDSVLNAAFQLVRREGANAFNARAVARELGGSTQPIFRLFSGMEELRAELLKRAEEEFMGQFNKRMEKDARDAYHTMGMTYLCFARDEPELFKLLFMRDRVTDGSCEREKEAYGKIFAYIAEIAKIDLPTARKLFERTWVYTHGLAVSIATKYVVCVPEETMCDMLIESFNAAAGQLGLSVRG